MRLISWNVNGLRAIEKKGFREWLLINNPDFLCLQETKANPDQLSAELLNIPGYYSYFSSAEKKGYSGVAIYCKNAIKVIEYGIGVKAFDSEGRIIIAEIASNILLYNIYFPNGNQSPARLKYKLEFYEAVLAHMQAQRKLGKAIICCGDVNTAHLPIDLARPKENENNSGFLPVERAWIDRLIGSGYIDTFRHFNNKSGEYSWWDYKTRARERNIGWRIDCFYICTELLEYLRNAFIMKEVSGSDHCPIGIEIDVL